MIITGGIYKGRKITVPSEKITRPTLSKVRMGVFNTLYSVLVNFEGKSFLDLFGGSGIMGIEAKSRGFDNITVFEKNVSAFKIIEKNYAELKIKADIKMGDSLKLIKISDKIFDVVYVDPPYANELLYDEVLNLLQDKARLIIVEHSDEIKTHNFKVYKIKKYGNTNISFLMSTCINYSFSFLRT